MVDPEHLKMLKQDVDAWNTWRDEHIEVILDLYGVDLASVNLSDAYLSGANLSGANLSGANLSGANLIDVDLSDANLTNAHMEGVDLSNADLTGADLQDANLTQATLVDTDVTDANFTGCKVYGISVWNLEGEPKGQNNLIITRWDPLRDEPGEPVIRVDDLEVAQFIYLLINHEKLRKVLKTVTSKVVLILGRFTPERKVVLDALADALRACRDEKEEARYLPVLFDFDPDTGRDLLETVQVIAGMSRFIIADITAPKAVLSELTKIIPEWKVPVKLIFDTSTGEDPAVMLVGVKEYPWVVRSAAGGLVSGYESTQHLCASIERIIDPLERKFTELEKAKAEKTLSVERL